MHAATGAAIIGLLIGQLTDRLVCIKKLKAREAQTGCTI